MILKKGQIVNDGANNLIVCDVRIFENNWYAYLLNESTDEVSFYKVIIDDVKYDFIEVIDEKLLQKLVIFFANENIKDKNVAATSTNIDN